MSPKEALDQLQSQGRFAEAAALAGQVLNSDPGDLNALNALAVSLQVTGKLPEARDVLLRAISLQPNLPELHYNLANVHRELGDFDAAIGAYRKTLSLRPDFGPALNNLANALKETGLLDEAADVYRKTLLLHPNPRTASNLAYLAYFDPHATPQRIHEQHAHWNRQFAQALAASSPRYFHDRAPGRVLRIGYVSPDFRNHPVGRFILPLLEQHDRSHFEIFCYSDVRRADSTTSRIRALQLQWRDTARLKDEQLAELIGQDRIDILVDLTMHMEGNRLLVFARRPAPVQVTYLAYAGTTGLTAMDYRLSDPHLDPPGSDLSVYSERTALLPQYWCYQPPIEAPQVGPLPALRAGYVTFGCLNNFSKINLPVLKTWRALLVKVPDSRLILSAHRGSHRARVISFFAQFGIAPDRIEFVPVLPFAEYLATYNRIDIALDPFPYPGGTTTFDGLYMGVPAVTLPGQTAVSRAGVSIMNNLGLPQLIARSGEHYVESASGLAESRDRLGKLREELRSSLVRSPLTNAPAFTAGVEAAYRQMWDARSGPNCQDIRT